MSEQGALPPDFFNHNILRTTSNPIWPVTVLALNRNFGRTNFPAKLSLDARSTLMEIEKDALVRILGKSQVSFINAEELSLDEAKVLAGRFFLHPFREALSKGQGFAIDAQLRFLAVLQIQDHFSLHWTDNQGIWEEAWREMARIEKGLADALGFAFCERFGYLTADFSTCGTGLSVFGYLHLPLLIHMHALQGAFDSLREIQYRAMESEQPDYPADIVVIQNQFVLGVSEEQILRTVYTAAAKLASMEKAARSTLSPVTTAHFKDLVGRAFGVLLHSYQLEIREALDALGMIKLGIDLGWIQGMSDAELNALLFRSRQIRLAVANTNTEDGDPGIDHRRAAFFHEELKSLVLV